MGFIDDIEWIFEQAPVQRQVALFSATMPEPIRRVARNHLTDPVEIKVKAKTETRPQPEFAVLAVRNDSPKNPTRVRTRPGCGQFITMATPATAALKSSVMESRANVFLMTLFVAIAFCVEVATEYSILFIVLIAPNKLKVNVQVRQAYITLSSRES